MTDPTPNLSLGAEWRLIEALAAWLKASTAFATFVGPFVTQSGLSADKLVYLFEDDPPVRPSNHVGAWLPRLAMVSIGDAMTGERDGFGMSSTWMESSTAVIVLQLETTKFNAESAAEITRAFSAILAEIKKNSIFADVKSWRQLEPAYELPFKAFTEEGRFAYRLGIKFEMKN